MERKNIVFFPAPGSSDGDNLFVRNMIELISWNYHVAAMEQISNDQIKIRGVQAVILNWAETELDPHMKRILLLYKLLGVKICWVFHNRVPHDCKKISQIKNMKWLADRCDCILLLSKASRQYLPNRKRNLRKCVYLPHINYIGTYPESERDIRKENGVGEDTFVYAFYGLIRPYKNLEILLQAFCELKLENAKLLIAGSIRNGMDIEELKKRCIGSDSVILWPGFIPNGEMEAFVRGCDLMVLPYSKVSSMNSGAMILAFSYARTVIVPEIAMGRDIKDKNFAFIYDYANEKENLEGLKEKMLEAYQIGRRGVHGMGERAKKYVKRNHNGKKVIEALEKAIHI